VEPGAFRTGLFNPGAAYLSQELPEYADTVGPTRAYVTGGDGSQPGDPAKAAAAILAALDAEQPSLRLALGGDAVDNIRASWTAAAPSSPPGNTSPEPPTSTSKWPVSGIGRSSDQYHSRFTGRR